MVRLYFWLAWLTRHLVRTVASRCNYFGLFILNIALTIPFLFPEGRPEALFRYGSWCALGGMGVWFSILAIPLKHADHPIAAWLEGREARCPHSLLLFFFTFGSVPGLLLFGLLLGGTLAVQLFLLPHTYCLDVFGRHREEIRATKHQLANYVAILAEAREMNAHSNGVRDYFYEDLDLLHQLRQDSHPLGSIPKSPPSEPPPPLASVISEPGPIEPPQPGESLVITFSPQEIAYWQSLPPPKDS